MSQETMQVLKMLAEGKLTVDQANQLLAALGEDRSAAPRGGSAPIPRPRNDAFGRLSPAQIVELRNHNVTPDYIRSMRSLGLEDMSLQHLIELRNHDIDPEYIRAMRATGLENLTVRKIIEMGIHNVTPDF